MVRRQLLMPQSSQSIPVNEFWYKTDDGNSIDLNGTAPFYDENGYELYPQSTERSGDYWRAICDSPIARIADFCFSGITNITDVVMPDTITSIGNSAFNGCYHLQNVTLSQNLNAIGINAFINCSWLNNIQLPNTGSLTEINEGAFSATILEEITIPESVTTLGPSVFYGCKNLKTAKILAPIATLQATMFKNATSLTEVELPDSITRIEEQCFYNCALTGITLGYNVKYIGSNVFISSSGKDYNMTIYAATPPTVSNSRSILSIDNVYVPASKSQSLYQSHSIWSTKNIYVIGN